MKILRYWRYWDVVVMVCLVVFTGVIRWLEMRGYGFAFTFDQARDVLDLRSIVVGGNLKMTGPTTSINGVFLGPAYYYVLAPVFWLSGGNPVWLLGWQVVAFVLSCVGVWWYLRRYDRRFALLVSSLWLLMPMGFVLGRYLWNAHWMPGVMVVYFGVLWAAGRENARRWVWLGLGLMAGVAMQFEAAFGVLCLPFAVMYLLVKRRWGWRWLWLVGGFGMTLVPQVLFEIKNRFVMSLVFLSVVRGESELLGESLSGSALLNNRAEQLRSIVLSSNHLPGWLVLGLLAVSIVIVGWLWWRGVLSELEKDWWGMGVGFWGLAIGFYMVYRPGLKEWYILGLVVPTVMVLAVGVWQLRRLGRYGMLVIGLFLVVVFGKTMSEQGKYLEVMPELVAENKSSMVNQMRVIDGVYELADGRGFRAYIYVDGVYDFPYQYVFWWYGSERYGYQPDELSYLPSQPVYFDNDPKYWTKQKASETVFLIIEPTEKEEFQGAWLGNFEELCVVQREVFAWGTVVEERGECEM